MAERRLVLSESTARQIAADSRKLAGLPFHVDRLAGTFGGVPYEFARFELAVSLTPGSTSPHEAYRLWFDGTNLSPQTSTSDGGEKTIEVIDPIGLYRGRARGAYSSPHNAGSRGWAVKIHDWPYWEIAWMQPHALLIRGTATSDVETTDTTFTIDNVVVMNPIGGIITDQDPAGSITVYNTFGWSIDNDGAVAAAWDESGDKWVAIQAACPS